MIDGPFPKTKELVAGFWIIQVKSTAEAIEWASRVPFADDEVIEVRQVLEASDFPPEIVPPEAAAHSPPESRQPLPQCGVMPTLSSGANPWPRLRYNGPWS